MKKQALTRCTALITLMVTLVALSTRLRADTQTTGTCGGASITIPFTDVPNTNIFFCAIAEAFFTGLTNGTSATTYSPADPVPREQMAAFITRTLDQSLRRGSRRAAIGKWWTAGDLNSTSVKRDPNDTNPQLVYCDGGNLWVAWNSSGTVSRHDLYKPELAQVKRWTGAAGAFGIISVGELAWITGFTNPGQLYAADFDNAAVIVAISNLPPFPAGIAFDGNNLWTANFGTAPGTGSISRIHLSTGVTTFTTGFSRPLGILFDGENIWVADQGDGVNNATLKRVNPATGAVTLTVTQAIGVGSGYPVFDGMNIWVPNHFSDSITVVRAVGGLAGTPLAVLTATG